MAALQTRALRGQTDCVFRANEPLDQLGLFSRVLHAHGEQGRAAVFKLALLGGEFGANALKFAVDECCGR